MTNPEISCANCIGVCCRKDTGMQLDRNEAAFLVQGGTTLREVLPAIPDMDWAATLAGQRSTNPPLQQIYDEAATLEPGQGKYVLTSDCAYLQKQERKWICTVYEDPRRPQACRDFAAGSPGCLVGRYQSGVDTAETFLTQLGMPGFTATPRRTNVR